MPTSNEELQAELDEAMMEFWKTIPRHSEQRPTHAKIETETRLYGGPQPEESILIPPPPDEIIQQPSI